MNFKIKDIENDQFYRFNSRGGRLKRVPGSAKKSVRISVSCESRDGVVTLSVRRPTRPTAVAVVKETLGLSDVCWGAMLLEYETRMRRDAAREGSRMLRIRKQQLKQLKHNVAAVEKVVKKAERKKPRV